LRDEYRKSLEKASASASSKGETAKTREVMPGDVASAGVSPAEEPVDAFEAYRRQAIERVRTDHILLDKLQSPDGVPWMSIKKALEEAMSEAVSDRSQAAHELVPRALNEILGVSAWETYKRPGKTTPTKLVTYVRRTKHE
jgi:hypothetical protein